MIFNWLKDAFTEAPGTKEGNLRRTMAGLSIWAASSLVWFLIYTLGLVTVGQWFVHGVARALGVFGYGALLGLAFAAVGALFGFLFGIPRTIQNENRPSSDTTSSSDSNELKYADYRQVVNTNLEQISDWLTKILVGIGLTQLTKIPQAIWRLASDLKAGLNDSQPVTVFIILNALVCGFFTGYLLTRLFLASAFSENRS
jgi:hypothetical protein